MEECETEGFVCRNFSSSFILLSSVDLWYPHLFKLKKHGKRTAHTGGKQTS